MLARNDAFPKIMKIVILTFSLFLEMRELLLQESHYSLLTYKINTKFKKRKHKMFSHSKRTF